MFEPLENRETEALAEFGEYVRKAVEAAQKAENDLIERKCEEALQGGEHGVFVLTSRDGVAITAAVHPGVPYGYIYRGPEEPDTPKD